MNFVFGQSPQRDYDEELRYQNDAINKMAANLEANTKSMDNLVALVTSK